MEFVPLTIAALEFRLGEEPGTDREWFTARMRDYLAYDPDGCFALIDHGETVGMVTAVCYQTVGWLGWLYVAQGRRGQGLGEQLMRQGTGYCIRRGMRTIVLEAVVEAVSLYLRVGFRGQFRTQHYRVEKSLLRTSEAAGVQVREIVPEDLARIGKVDQRLFHQDRSRMLGILAANPLFRGWLAERDREVYGYLLLTEASGNCQVGPMVVTVASADGAAIASQLCRAAMDGSGKPLVIRCPLVTEDRANVLAALGAQPMDYHTVRMYAGEVYVPEDTKVLSLGCPGKG